LIGGNQFFDASRNRWSEGSQVGQAASEGILHEENGSEKHVLGASGSGVNPGQHQAAIVKAPKISDSDIYAISLVNKISHKSLVNIRHIIGQ
jgi:hypothetical protein